MTETARVRAGAADLLGRLLAERERMELRLAESGRADPLKSITGRSALDNAIAATREMIRNMDDLLAEAEATLAALEEPRLVLAGMLPA